jgi:hypothetical protein
MTLWGANGSNREHQTDGAPRARTSLFFRKSWEEMVQMGVERTEVSGGGIDQ